MKTRLALVLSLLIALLLTITAAYANPTVTIDENGNGTDPSGAALSWYVGADWGPGGLSNALTYYLPGYFLVQGDLIMDEPSAPTGTLSDVVRFNPSTAGTYVVFYSDPAEPGETPSLADTGFPSAFYSGYTSNVTVTEQGTEAGPNGYYYAPIQGQPGFCSASPLLSYQIISDPATTPEPGSLAALASGLVGLAGFAFKKRH